MARRGAAAATGLDERARQAEVLVGSCAMSDADRAFMEEAGRIGVYERTCHHAHACAAPEPSPTWSEAPKVGRDHLCEAVGFRLREGGV